MADEASGLWLRAGDYVADRMGLHFPPDRTADLQRGFAEAARELAFPSGADCAWQLLAGRLDVGQVECIINHLTIGETYFWRGTDTFDALARHVLPALVRARTGQGKRLRLWSAACCTGEEAYSLAILLRESLPDINDWHITILATDLNPRFLRKATEGIYGKWSFRDTPKGFCERHFRSSADGRFVLRPEIRRMVTFAPLNLAENVYPSLATGTNAMDLILCRNVLMYFEAAQARRVAANLHRSLAPDGWLVVAPCEVSQALFSQFTPVGFDGAILYRRNPDRPASRTEAPPVRVARVEVPHAHPASIPAPASRRRSDVFRRHAAGVPMRTTSAGTAAATAESAASAQTHHYAREARRAADEGRLGDALTWCDRWIERAKLDADAHYLRAIVLMECGRGDDARAALQRSAFLQPEAPMTSFALANLERGLGRGDLATRHLRNTLELLDRCGAADELQHSEGITAGQLAVLVNDLLATESPR
jgi:chemotaxis protein methyltransferase CheR